MAYAALENHGGFAPVAKKKGSNNLRREKIEGKTTMIDINTNSLPGKTPFSSIILSTYKKSLFMLLQAFLLMSL